MNPAVELYTDGSCLNNPGPGGIGYIIKYFAKTADNEMPEAKEIKKSEGYRSTTNNRMELLAAIKGLEDIIALITSNVINDTNEISIMSDSKYFCDAINLRWIQKWESNNWMTSGFRGSQPKAVKNKDLWESYISIQNKIQSMNFKITITHIMGHHGHAYNEACDQLAQSASRGTTYLIDEKYEMTNNQR